jgi:hypothetical protein
MKKSIIALVLSVSPLSVFALAPLPAPTSSCFYAQSGNVVLVGSQAQQARICSNDPFPFKLLIDGKELNFEATSCVSVYASNVTLVNGKANICVTPTALGQ